MPDEPAQVPTGDNLEPKKIKRELPVGSEVVSPKNIRINLEIDTPIKANRKEASKQTNNVTSSPTEPAIPTDKETEVAPDATPRTGTPPPPHLPGPNVTPPTKPTEPTPGGPTASNKNTDKSPTPKNDPATPKSNTPTSPLQALRDNYDQMLDQDESEDEDKEDKQVPPNGQNPPPGNKVTPGEEANAANQLKKDRSLKQMSGDLMKGAGNMAKKAGTAAKNFPGNVKNAGKGIANAIKNPKQFAKKAADKIVGAVANKVKNELGSIKFKKLRLARDIKKLEKEIDGLMNKLGKEYNDLKGSLAMWIFSLLFPALHDKIRGVFNFKANVGLKLLILQLKPKVIAMKALKKTLQGAQGAFSVLDAVVITWQLVMATYGILIILSPAIFIFALIIFYIFGCGRFSSITKKILDKIKENLGPLEEKLGYAEKALVKQKELSALTKEYSQTKMLEMEKKKTKKEESKDSGDQPTNDKEEGATASAAPQPAEEAAPQPAEEAAPQPAEEAAPQPAEEAAPQPAEEAAPQPAEEGKGKKELDKPAEGAGKGPQSTEGTQPPPPAEGEKGKEGPGKPAEGATPEGQKPPDGTQASPPPAEGAAAPQSTPGGQPQPAAAAQESGGAGAQPVGGAPTPPPATPQPGGAVEPGTQEPESETKEEAATTTAKEPDKKIKVELEIKVKNGTKGANQPKTAPTRTKTKQAEQGDEDIKLAA